MCGCARDSRHDARSSVEVFRSDRITQAAGPANEENSCVLGDGGHVCLTEVACCVAICSIRPFWRMSRPCLITPGMGS